MKWNFPITKTVKCDKCAKEFELTLIDRNSKTHTCPHCGTIYTFDFEAAEKKAVKEFEEAIRKKFRG